MSDSSPQRVAAVPPIVETFRQAGQGQVFAFYDRLDEAGRRQLIEQAQEIDLEEIDRLVRTLVTGSGQAGVAREGTAPAP